MVQLMCAIVAGGENKFLEVAFLNSQNSVWKATSKTQIGDLVA